MGPNRNPRWEQKRTEGYVIVSRLLALQKRLATPLIEPANHGILPPIHGISNSLPMVHITPCYGVMNPPLLEEMRGSIYHDGVQNTITEI